MDGLGTPNASGGAGGTHKTALDQLKSWVETEKGNGLNDVKFFPGEIKDATVESFAKEVNELLHGKEVPITDLD